MRPAGNAKTTVGLGTDTYTFLFTDIVGSTRLLESSEVAMVAAVDLHDSLLPPLFESHGGHVFKNMGDAYCVAFRDSLPALQAAIAGQRVLSEQAWALPQPLRVRMALHTGPAQTRGDDYRGLALSRAARLMNVTHGGQILLSETAGVGLSEALPTDVSLLNLGSVRLPSLERPERVYQAVAPGLERDFPSLRSLENLPNNLKDQLTSFVGREREMAEVMDICLSRRLVTLTGTGGCGKTRLALQAAAELIGDFEDGVWLVELAGVTDPAVVPFAVASELKVRQEGDQTVEDALIAYLKTCRLLLILDNCEQIVDASARLVQTLLQAVPGLKILATSRERLNVAGETVWCVPPLSGPSSRASPLDSILESDAASLFIERAVAAYPPFRLSAGNARAVAQVCRRLEGLPLALELAASRVGVLTVEQFAARLDDRLRLLPAGPRGGAARHRTLQATLDWSYELLTEPERMLLCRLSVFAGGCTLEAAESVCAGAGIEALEVLDLLSHLVDKSLVVMEEQEGAARYRLLETLRAYSLEKLRARLEAEDWQARHAAYFLEWAETAEPHLNGPEQANWLNRIEEDHDNLRAALRYLSETDPERFQRLASALYSFWYTRGYLTEGRTWLEEAVADAASLETLARAKAVNRAGIFAWAQGNYVKAEERIRQSLAICSALKAEGNVAAALRNLAMIASNRGDFDEANRLQNEGLEISRRLNDLPSIAVALHNLGATAAERGQEHVALGYYEESLALFRETGNETGIAMALQCLGAAAYRSGDFQTAGKQLRESLLLCERLGNLRGIAFVLAYLGYLAVARGSDALAVRLLGRASALRTSLKWPENPYDARMNSGHLDALHRRLSAEEFARLWIEGESLTTGDALAVDEA